MFATEPITASLAGLLQSQDDQERVRNSGRSRRRPNDKNADNEDSEGELELDVLEIQKGLLQVAKGLEFLY